MARFLYYTTHGTDDPTRAGLAFTVASGLLAAATFRDAPRINTQP